MSKTFDMAAFIGEPTEADLEEMADYFDMQRVEQMAADLIDAGNLDMGKFEEVLRGG